MSQDLTTTQVARLLGVSGDCVRWNCRAGRLGRRVLGRWRIADAEVQALLGGAGLSPQREGLPRHGVSKKP
jgi:hypothetical protein